MAIYTEDDFEYEVEILEDTSNEKQEEYKLKITKIIKQSEIYKESHVGDVFDVFQVREGAWGGMWFLEKTEEEKVTETAK